MNLLALQSQDSLAQGQANYLLPILRTMVNAPGIRAAVVTDTNGRIIASSDPGTNGQDLLTRLEKKHLEDTNGAVIFRVPGGAREAVQAIHVGGQLSGFAWVYRTRCGRPCSTLFAHTHHHHLRWPGSSGHRDHCRHACPFHHPPASRFARRDPQIDS